MRSQGGQAGCEPLGVTGNTPNPEPSDRRTAGVMIVSHRTRDSFTTSVEWLHPKMPLLAGRDLRSRLFGVAGVLSRPERANVMRHELFAEPEQSV